MTKLVFLCILLRILSVFMVQTSFVPDEYWQSLEVAHKMAFGYGYLTWEWRLGIRSYIYPAAIACLFKALEFFKCDTVGAIVFVPRLAQVLLSAVGDYFFVKWHKQTTGLNGNWAWFVVLTSWFWFYCASRTLTNTLETTLSMIGLYLYPWQKVVFYNRPRTLTQNPKQMNIRLSYLWFAGFACTVRPTAAIFWLPLGLFHIMTEKRKLGLILTKLLPIAATVIVITMEIDSYFHGERVLTWWNFFVANVLYGVGEFYGSHPVMWYFYIGLPAILGLQFVPFLFGLANILKKIKTFKVEIILILTLIWMMLMLSSSPHKEFRFLLPALPLCLHLTASCMSDWSRRANTRLIWASAILIAVSSIVLNIFLGMHHQRGTLDVMKYLAEESKQDPRETNLLFLMPCHSTPLYSHLHVNVTTRFLTCEPYFSGCASHADEAEIFYADPEGWLTQTFPINNTCDLPTHIIMFDPLRDQISNFLKAHGYLLANQFFHTMFPEGPVGEYVYVFKQLLCLKTPQTMFIDQFTRKLIY